MPTERLPFVNNQQSGLERLAGGIELAINVLIDPLGCVTRRPGIGAYSGASATAVNALGISGIFGVSSGDLYAVAGAIPSRRIYRVTSAGAVDVSALSGSTFQGDQRPIFAETEALLAITAGGPPQKVLFATKLTSRLANAPDGATHIIANSSRLAANDPDNDRSKVLFSDQASGSSYAGFELWSFGQGTAGFFSAESRPDPIVAIHENTNELFIFGTTNFQVFSSDPQTVYAPVVTREIGCSAPYSIIKADQQFAWLDDRRRIVTSDGRGIEVLSSPIQATLNDIVDVSDCWAFRYCRGPFDVLVWVFPSDGRSFAFQKESGWSQWMGSTGGNYRRLQVDCAHFRQDTDDHLVGTPSGRVALLSEDVTTDLGDPIIARVDTGFIDRGSDSVKSCNRVSFTLRRGLATSGEPSALLSWRDNEGPWGSPIRVSLGNTSDRELVVHYHSLGVYRRRQWRFEFSGTEVLTLVSAKEEFTVEEN